LEKVIDQIKSRIDEAIMAIANTKPQRTYLGASSIGEECDRKIWYAFHTPIRISDPRVHRIMDYGHFSESYVLSMLKHSGFTVYQDESDQFGFTDEEVAGHCDGVIMLNDEPYLLEIKSANDKRFAEMKKDGVQKSNPTYFIQMQVYMKYMELSQALYFVINKNTCEIHMEIIKYEAIKADYAVSRGKEIIRGEKEAAQRKYKSSAFFKCKFCDHREKCWDDGAPKPPEEVLSSFKLGGDFLLPKHDRGDKSK